MSRCFPFPPPGYGKKAIADEVDLLKKEKQKEKKHKKEKREKEKRESKDKREKEGRDGKHKEKKDKKEKHREKKKDKDKDRDKDKSKDRDKSKVGTADDKGFPRQVEGPNAGKLHQKEIKQDDKKGTLFENRLTKQNTVNNGEKAREKNHLAEENKDSKFLLEFDRRIRNDDGGAGNQLFHKFTNTDHRKDEGTVRLVAKSGGTWPDGYEKLKDKGIDAKKIDGRRIHAEVQSIGNAPVQNHYGNLHPRVDGIPNLLGKYFEKNLEATFEGKEKVKEKKNEEKEKVKEKTGERKVKEKKDEGKEKVKEKNDDKRRDKRKEKEKKKGHGKDKDRDKEKKKEEKAKEHSEPKTTEQNKLKDSNKIGIVDSNSFPQLSKNNHNKIGIVDSNSFPQLSKNNHENAVSGENLKKRKDIESNGVPRANDSLPNKFPRLSSTHPFTENGRILEPCQIPIPNASDSPQVATGVKVENKERKKNGIIETKSNAASSNKTHTATMPVDLVTETSAKPHPDAKYLSQVYSVPKVEQWSEFDGQEWLFSSNVSQGKKSVVESSEVGETPQVWAEALHIESADVFALPYVIPY